MHDLPPARARSLPPQHVLAGALAALLLALLVLSAAAVRADAASAATGTKVPSRSEQLRFMWAMAGQESGWDYYSRNRSSGAYGKYQIMPFNWPEWADKYLGTPFADQTPWNQEVVAYGKLRDLHKWLGSWRRVAYWWLTGSSELNQKRWSGYASGYVDNVMHLRDRAPRDSGDMPRRTAGVVSRGDWRVVDGKQKLRRSAGGRAWRRGGRLRDGQLVRVHRAKASRATGPWLLVVTVEGRLGWVLQVRTVPARRPRQPERWGRVTDRGEDGAPADRSQVRPRPR